MKKRLNTFFQKKLVKYLFIPLLLLFLWAVLSLIYIIVYDKSFLVLSYNLPQSDFKTITYNRLTKGEKISGEFVANENNLGIIEMRFVQFLRIPYNQEDVLVFRIKEKGQQNWYYQGHFRSGLTFELPLIPFGFPVIADSKGKTYNFELESLHGNTKNAVVLSDHQPNLISKYQVQKHAIISKPKELLMFAFKKIVISSQSKEVIFSSFVYLLPFLIYLIYLTPLRKLFLTQLHRFKYLSVFSTILLIIVFIDVFFLQIMNDILYLVVMFAWVISLRIQRQHVRVTFIFGFILLLFTLVYYLFNEITMALSACIWSYVFLTTATLQVLFAPRKKDSI